MLSKKMFVLSKYMTLKNGSWGSNYRYNVTKQSRPVIDFFEMQCEIGNHFPGFETDIHGVYNVDGIYKVKVIKQ